MKKQNAKARDRKVTKVEKPRRGRPRKTDAEKAPDQRKLLVSEVKADLMRVKKSQKRLARLMDKAQAEQGALMAALLESLGKIKTELKKKPKKVKTGKRGRPAGKPGKPGRAPKAKRGRPAKPVTEGAAPKRKRGRPRKIVAATEHDAKKEGPTAPKADGRRPTPKQASPANDEFVTPIPKPGKKAFKKAASKSSKKVEAKEEAAPTIAPDEEPKTE